MKWNETYAINKHTKRSTLNWCAHHIKGMKKTFWKSFELSFSFLYTSKVPPSASLIRLIQLTVDATWNLILLSAQCYLIELKNCNSKWRPAICQSFTRLPMMCLVFNCQIGNRRRVLSCGLFDWRNKRISLWFSRDSEKSSCQFIRRWNGSRWKLLINWERGHEEIVTVTR